MVDHFATNRCLYQNSEQPDSFNERAEFLHDFKSSLSELSSFLNADSSKCLICGERPVMSISGGNQDFINSKLEKDSNKASFVCDNQDCQNQYETIGGVLTTLAIVGAVGGTVYLVRKKRACKRYKELLPMYLDNQLADQSLIDELRKDAHTCGDIEDKNNNLIATFPDDMRKFSFKNLYRQSKYLQETYPKGSPEYQRWSRYDSVPNVPRVASEYSDVSDFQSGSESFIGHLPGRKISTRTWNEYGAYLLDYLHRKDLGPDGLDRLKYLAKKTGDVNDPELFVKNPSKKLLTKIFLISYYMQTKHRDLFDKETSSFNGVRTYQPQHEDYMKKPKGRKNFFNQKKSKNLRIGTSIKQQQHQNFNDEGIGLHHKTLMFDSRCNDYGEENLVLDPYKEDLQMLIGEYYQDGIDGSEEEEEEEELETEGLQTRDPIPIPTIDDVEQLGKQISGLDLQSKHDLVNHISELICSNIDDVAMLTSQRYNLNQPEFLDLLTSQPLVVEQNEMIGSGYSYSKKKKKKSTTTNTLYTDWEPSSSPLARG